MALISFLYAEARENGDKKAWERIGLTSFGLHILGIFGIIGTLFYLIYSHQYQYHYVWAHSSNELPVYYIISCFWEGQEGSFLLWCFWHSVLGGIIMFAKHEWRNMVLGIIASVELILSSMILGVYVGDGMVWGIFIILALLPAIYLGYRLRVDRENLPMNGNMHIGGIIMAGTFLMMLFRGQTAFQTSWSWGQTFGSISGLTFTLFILFVLGFGVLYFAYLARVRKSRDTYAASGLESLAGLFILSAGIIACFFEPDTWKVGSTPFILLQSVFPDNEVYLQNPDFIPSNGSGLNSLLQNYWMVIHPPTLFLGFASTVVPFAFVVGGLIKGKYHEWIRYALPWTSFSVMILGVGIIMGGYWAYETLNFGGYWNWDPVENGSLVPWLCGVASLHAMLIYQKSKSYLRLAQILIVGTFLLVLYATFLTRSGILGDTSVHTFTDLGLSGQLLILVLVYLAVVTVMFMLRWKEIPHKEEEGKFWSAENMLFLGVLVFVLSGAEILLSTSLPVINKIFGTNMAPPPNIQLFYYQWNVWFAIAFGVLSGVGQFLWWRIGKKEGVAKALYRPFLAAMISGSLISLALLYFRKEFAYQSIFEAYIADANMPESFFGQIFAYIQYGVMAIADDLMLFASLFVVLANTDVLISMLRKNRKGLKVMGGTVVHIGFGFMLLGILFSSGYDEVISRNLYPEELAGMPNDEQIDNVRLLKDFPRPIEGFQLTYVGRKEAVPPVSNIRVIEQNEIAFKIRFYDSTGDEFAIVLPSGMFHADKSKVVDKPGEQPKIDLQLVEKILNDNIKDLNPGHINGRFLYGIEFASAEDTTKSFILYPEAEINGEESGIIAHPARKVFWTHDLYVHVSSIPDPEESKPKYAYHDLQMKVGDTFTIGNVNGQLMQVTDLSRQREELKQYQVAAAALIKLTAPTGDTLMADPIYVIDENNRPGMIDSRVQELAMDFAFIGVDPQNEVIMLQVRQQENPGQDNV
ncbi:MAG: cytochrome c biogenesis protein CcsA, partial [Bacteroidota bacterium]